MGRVRDDVQQLVARTKAKGYERGANKERDEVRNHHKHVDKTKREHDAALNRYVLWEGAS
jgi:hypothetical protein